MPAAPSTRLVNKRVHLPRYLVRKAGHGLQLFSGRLQEALRRPEVAQNRLLSFFPHARQLIQQRAVRTGRASRSMVADGEAVNIEEAKEELKN